MKYDREVTTITDILETLDKFDNKEEIINAIKQSLYDIETDWHHEEYLRHQLQAYKNKEDKLREYVNNIKSSGVNSHFDAPFIKENILQILNEGDK